jgi:hypothetical protein
MHVQTRVHWHREDLHTIRWVFMHIGSCMEHCCLLI